MSRARLIMHGRVGTDTTPDAFTFTDVTSAPLSTTETSNTITIAGLGSGVSVAVTVTGGTYSKNGGSYVSSAGTAQNGDTFAVRHTSSSGNSTATDTTLTVGGVSDTFTSTTLASGAAYDTRFGTATDSDGWITFDLKPGCRRVWVNSSGGNDANNGLSAANAKATWNAAVDAYNTGHTPGDQLMVAGTGSRSYNDTGGLHSITATNGDSLTYPNAVLSYDPADAANSAKYGKLLGADRPRIVHPASWDATGASSFSSVTTDRNFFFVQGLEFVGYESTGTSNVFYVGKRNGLGFQNTHWNRCSLTFDFYEDFETASWATNIHLSKSCGFGQWTASGNNNWTYIAGTGPTDGTGLYLQDLITVHNGWKIGAARSDALASGGAYHLGHGIYFGPTSDFAHFDRIVGVDCAQDPFSFRGGLAATCLVSLDNPIVGSIGGFSNHNGDLTDPEEAPNGKLITWTDATFMGGDDISSGSPPDRGAEPTGFGPGSENTVLGSFLKNVAMFDNPKKGTVNSYALTSGVTRSAEIDNHFLFEKIRAYLYASQFESPGGNFPAKLNNVHNDCIYDTLTSSNPQPPNTILTSVTTYGSPPAGYQTRDQIVTTMLTGMGVTPGANYAARKIQLVNWMIEYPHLRWAEALDTLGLQAMGLAPMTHAATAPPSVSGLTAPRSVY